MDAGYERGHSATGRRKPGAEPFRSPVASGYYDRMLAAAHELSLDVLASPAAAVIDAEACADWLAAEVARDRQEPTHPERRGGKPDRRRR